MVDVNKRPFALFVDRGNRRWIVRDPDGNYWMLPPGEDAWARREPFQATEKTALEPVPGHYKNSLRIPY